MEKKRIQEINDEKIKKRKGETYVQGRRNDQCCLRKQTNIYNHVQRRNIGPAHVQNPLAKRRMQIARAIPSRSPGEIFHLTPSRVGPSGSEVRQPRPSPPDHCLTEGSRPIPTRPSSFGGFSQKLPYLQRPGEAALKI